MDQILGMFVRQYYTVVKTAVDSEIRLPGMASSLPSPTPTPAISTGILFNLSEPQFSGLYVGNSTSREEEAGEPRDVWKTLGIASVPEQVVYIGCCFLWLLIAGIFSCQSSCFSWKLIGSVCLFPLGEWWLVCGNIRQFSEDWCLWGTLTGKQQFIDLGKMFHVNVKPQRKEKYFLLLFFPSEAVASMTHT